MLKNINFYNHFFFPFGGAFPLAGALASRLAYSSSHLISSSGVLQAFPLIEI
jgi:hypothetical protein